MKILSIGYYDDFARFFLEIKKEFIKKDKNITFKYLSLYLSGYLYFLFRLENVSFFSFKVWTNKILNKNKYLNIIPETNIYKGVELKKIIKYHTLLNEEDELELKLQAIAYINIIEKLLIEFNPDILILSGDSRMSIEIFNIKAKELNIKTYYFEQGPFGTTILDTKGVNANASFRNKEIVTDKSIEEMSNSIENFYKRQRSAKYKRNPVYRGSDYIFQYLFSKIGLIPIDIKMEKETIEIKDIYLSLSTDVIVEEKKIFLLILQVPYDVNMVYHSPFYTNHFEIVKDVYSNLPLNTQLLVREHPLFKGKYEKELFEFMYQNKISLDSDDLYSSINKSDVIIVNNSTVGIEAISKLKTLVILGNSYYDNTNICLKLKEKDNLNNLLSSAIDFVIDKKNVLSFLDDFLNNYLIDGHFRDTKLIASKNIAKEILNDI